MRHISSITRTSKPALAGDGPNIFDCLSYLVDTGDLEGFKDCLAEKFSKES